MKISSRKAKGRRLQNFVKEKLIEALGFTEDDIRTAIMGEGGADIKMNIKASCAFPFDIECKNQEGYGKIYDAYDQASAHGNNYPLVIIKSNKKKPLAVIDLDHFIGFVKGEL